MFFIVVGAILLGGVILVGGGHTVQGLGQDIQQTTNHMQGK